MFEKKFTAIAKKWLAVWCGLAIAVGLVFILFSEALAQEKEKVSTAPDELTDVQKVSFPATPLRKPGEEEPGNKEWFGTDLPWWEWSRMTGNWAGRRKSLEDAGITIEGAAIFDVSRVASGGLRSRWIARSLLDFQAALDLKKLLDFELGTLSARYYSFFGRDASRDVGDIQAFDNLDANRQRHQLAEFWYEQKFFNETLRLKVGKVDTNSEFAFTENGAEFIHSSMGFSPTLIGFSSYPDPAMSVNLFVYPTDYLYVGFGAYDGAAQKGYETGSRGPATFFRGLNKLMYVGEVGGKWVVARLPGRLAIGGWHHNGAFDRFDETRKSGTSGLYLTLDQMLWRAEPAKDDDKKGIGLFFQYGKAEPSVSEIQHHIGGGLSWTGPIPNREEDVLGWGTSWVRLSSAPGAGFAKKHELAIETFYKIKVTGWFSLKPDLQYIVNPSGAQGVKNALVPTMRFEWQF